MVGRSIVEMVVLFSCLKVGEMRLGMEVTLARIMMLLRVIHNENMTMYKMFLGKNADELIAKYNYQFDEVLEMEIDMEK